MMTPVVDAFGGTSVESHQAGIERIAQADARPITWVALIFQLRRDWNRQETVPGFAKILFSVE